jgi:hypothetical protein
MEKGILKYFNTVYKKYNNLYKLKVNTCLRLAKLKKQPFQIFDEMVDDLNLVTTPELAQELIDKLFNVEYLQLRGIKVMAFSALISNLIKDESTKENILAKSKFNNEANSILFKFSKKLMLLQSKLEKSAEDITEAFFAEDAILREVALLHN